MLPYSSFQGDDPGAALGGTGTLRTGLTGGRVMSIPHNGNLSNGIMWDDRYGSTARPLDAAYAHNPHALGTRRRGHPGQGRRGGPPAVLSPGPTSLPHYERLGSLATSWTLSAVTERRHAAVRSYGAFRAETRPGSPGRKLGVNPFQFGMIGSTDCPHVRWRQWRRTTTSASIRGVRALRPVPR